MYKSIKRSNANPPCLPIQGAWDNSNSGYSVTRLDSTVSSKNEKTHAHQNTQAVTVKTHVGVRFRKTRGILLLQELSSRATDVCYSLANLLTSVPSGRAPSRPRCRCMNDIVFGVSSASCLDSWGANTTEEGTNTQKV